MVRHTAVDIPEGTCYGQTNVPLKPSFENEANLVKQNLVSVKFDAVLSSPLDRCRRLAKYCGYTNIIYHDRLKELHMGDWEMQKWDDIDMSIWDKDWVNNPAPNGESFSQMYNRVSSLMDEVTQENYNKVLIFAHGGVISCARVYFKQADIQSTFDLMPNYGEIVEFDTEF